MVLQAEEARRYLHPIQLLQEKVYGKSYLDENSRYLSINEGDLAETYAAKLYKADIDRRSGHDLIRPNGETIEVRFRRLYEDSSSSGLTSCIDKLLAKTANKLCVLIYNPATETLDRFEYNQGEFGERVTIRWSVRNGDYTEGGGKLNRVG